MFYKKGRMSNFRKARAQGKIKRKKYKIGPCFHCKKQGHLIVECPSLQATSSRRIQEKKALKATWDGPESKSDKDVYVANMRFIANDEALTKVNSEPYLDDDE